MNKLCCLIIMFITCGVCEAQNLVPNPSFEDTVYCPFGIDQMDACSNWSSYGESSDYFHAGCQMGVPLNPFGYQFAADGNAYSGVVTFLGVGNYREYIGSMLSFPLSIGTKYFVSFYVNKADAPFSLNASNKLGVLFSTVAYSKVYPAPTNNFAYIYSDSIITDTLNWTQISGSFIADSAYQFIVLGNFFDKTHTDTLNLGLGNVSYYYIDNVCVSIDSLTCNSTVGINEVKSAVTMILFPNPFADKINITTKRNELIEVNLFDITSRKILHQSFINSISLNTEQLSKGIYLYEVRNKSGVIKKGKVVKD